MFENTYILTEWLKESNLHFKKTKELSKKTRNYYNGDQLDTVVKMILANRGQPEQYENQIAKHNNAILGFRQEQAIDIKLFGRQQKDRASADMLNALLKAITQVSDYEDQVTSMDNELSIEGISVAELSIANSGEFDEFGREHKDVEINYVPQNEIFLDPFSKAKNYNKDARYISRCFWIDVDDLSGLGFPEEKIKYLSNRNFLSSVLDDDLQTDTNIRKRTQLVYTWYRKYDPSAKKDKYYYVFWSGQTILKQGESPFDFEGFPYEVEFLNRDFEGKIKYWGLYRDIIPIQDNINYAKLRLQNMLANTKTLVNRGSLIDQDIKGFAAEWSFDNAVVEVIDINGIRSEKQNVQIQQILNIILDNRKQISELLNTNNEMLGTANNRMSGVGQEQRIETGLVGLSRFTKSSDRIQKKIMHKTVALICQYYDTQRVVSIIDEDYAQEYITMNQAQRNVHGGVDFEYHEDGTATPKATNTIVIGKYDLIFTTKPRTSTMNAERYAQNVEILKVLQATEPELVKFLLPDMLKDSEGSAARKIRNYIEQRDAQANSPQAQQMQQRMQQLQDENERLNMIVKQSQANLNNTKAQAMTDKNRIDLQKAFSNALIAKQSIQAANDKNQLQSMQRVS